MSPGLVWLNLIPVFNWFWQFWTVVQIGNSLRREYDERGLGGRDDSYGEVPGVILCSIGMMATVVNWGGRALDLLTGEQQISQLASMTATMLSVPWLVLWIVYWVKINGYTKQLNATRARAEEEDHRADDDGDELDDRPSRSRRDDFEDDYRPRNRS